MEGRAGRAEEAGLESGSLGASQATRAGQTEGGARNASQRRCRAFRHALVCLAPAAAGSTASYPGAQSLSST